MRRRSSKELRAIHAKGTRSTGRSQPTRLTSQPYRHGDYTLYCVEGKNGEPLYFFRRTGTKGKGKPSSMPPGRRVVTTRNGVPVLAKEAT